MTRSEELFQRAVKRIPGGVNSPVRAFGSVDEAPRFIQGAVGSKIFDVDGNTYTDYIGSWGPMILGHNDERVKEAVIRASENGLSFGCATEREVEMAEFICERIPHVEMIRMVNSGTEAVMSAIRTARGFTGKNKIIKFAGLLSRPYRRHAGKRRKRRYDQRRTGQRRSTKGLYPGHYDRRLQRSVQCGKTYGGKPGSGSGSDRRAGGCQHGRSSSKGRFSSGTEGSVR